VVVLALLAPSPAALAQGEPPSRAEFVEAADDICEVPYRKGLRLLGRATISEQQGDFRSAGRKIQRAGRKFLGVNRRVSKLEPPTADETLVAAWLTGTRKGFKQTVKSGKAMERGSVRRSHRVLKRAQRTTRRANKKVAALGFNFCA
jgi:hypothetical protein